MHDHFRLAERALGGGDTAAAQVHALLAVAQRLDRDRAEAPAPTSLQEPPANGATASGQPATSDEPVRPARFDVVLRPGEDVVAAVNAAPPGSTLLLPPGVVRGAWGLRPADGVQVWSQGTTNLRGTTLLPAGAWTRDARSRWRTRLTVRLLPDYATTENSRDPFDLNVQPEMLFAEGLPLLRVPSDPGPAQWSIEDGGDGSTHLVTGESPHEAMLELAHAGPGGAYDAVSSGASDVVLANLHLSHYAVPLFRGAVGRHHDDGDAMGSGWRLHAVAVTDVSAAGLSLGPGATMTRSFVTRCAQVGVRVSGGDDHRGAGVVTMRDSAVSGCGQRGLVAREAGGVHVEGCAAVGERLWLHDNEGNGWVVRDDPGAATAALRSSLVERNGSGGVVLHRCAAGEGTTHDLAENVVRGNGEHALLGTDEGAGIALVDTRALRLVANLVQGNAANQVVLADDGAPPGLRDVELRANHLAGRAPLVRLRRGRNGGANPRSEVRGGDNVWHALPDERVVVLPDGRLADLDGWALDGDRRALPEERPATPFVPAVRADATVGPVYER